jgi:LacI family transcriptional regulator
MSAARTGGQSRHARPTMKDVAALAGVAIKTVSRVMNGDPTVAPDLAARIRDAAGKLGYRPNLTASSLRRGDRRTATIGLLLDDVANPFSAALLRAVEDVARERRVQILIGSLDEDPDRERDMAITLIDRGVDGLVIMPAAPDQSYLVAERRLGTRVVFVDREPRFLDADAVVSSNRLGAVAAVNHLCSFGHRRIAYLGDSPAIAIRATTDILGLADPPTALFASQNLVTIGTVKALRQSCLQETIALVGFDDFPLADVLVPGITAVTQDVAQLGCVATQLLFARLDGDDSPARTHVVPTGMVTRGSGEIRPAPTMAVGG